MRVASQSACPLEPMSSARPFQHSLAIATTSAEATTCASSCVSGGHSPACLRQCLAAAAEQATRLAPLRRPSNKVTSVKFSNKFRPIEGRKHTDRREKQSADWRAQSSTQSPSNDLLWPLVVINFRLIVVRAPAEGRSRLDLPPCAFFQSIATGGLYLGGDQLRAAVRSPLASINEKPALSLCIFSLCTWSGNNWWPPPAEIRLNDS